MNNMEHQNQNNGATNIENTTNDEEEEWQKAFKTTGSRMVTVFDRNASISARRTGSGHVLVAETNLVNQEVQKVASNFFRTFSFSFEFFSNI